MSWLYGLMFAWMAQFAIAMWFAWRFPAEIGRALSREREPPVAVVAPVKGAGPDLADFVARLRSFAYSDYSVLAVVEAEADPAYAALLVAARGEGAPMTVRVAGLSEARGQKVHNLLHALAHLGPRPEIVAFVDADTLPSKDWLTRLVRPLVREQEIAAVTGSPLDRSQRGRSSECGRGGRQCVAPGATAILEHLLGRHPGDEARNDRRDRPPAPRSAARSWTTCGSRAFCRSAGSAF